MTAPELKPCPFCDGEPEWVDIPDDKFSNTGGSVIECMSCGASTHVEFGFKENLVSAWNTRTDRCIRRDDPVLRQAMESLKLYAGGCDATETAPCGYEGNLCCMSARAALAALQELIGKT